jgi:hypothetical protein
MPILAAIFYAPRMRRNETRNSYTQFCIHDASRLEYKITQISNDFARGMGSSDSANGGITPCKQGQSVAFSKSFACFIVVAHVIL